MSTNKRSLRPINLDNNKKVPFYKKEEISTDEDVLGQNRSVSHIPTGMEKEEESEHHLQKAMSDQNQHGDKPKTVIPTPDTQSIDLNTIHDEQYNSLYKDSHCLLKKFHKAPKFNLSDTPDYDLDDEDTEFFLCLTSVHKISITEIELESYIEQLENYSSSGNVTFEKLQSLLEPVDSNMFQLIYNYWKNKSKNDTIVHKVREQRKDGSNDSDPYVAFRKTTKNIQTRKNCNENQAGYEKMLRIKREISDAKKLMNMISTRENIKTNLEVQYIKVFEKQRELNDYDNKQYKESCKEITHHQQTLEARVNQKKNKRKAEGLIPVNKKKIKTDFPSKRKRFDMSTSKKMMTKRNKKVILHQLDNEMNRVNNVKEKNQVDSLNKFEGRSKSCLDVYVF